MLRRVFRCACVILTQLPPVIFGCSPYIAYEPVPPPVDGTVDASPDADHRLSEGMILSVEGGVSPLYLVEGKTTKVKVRLERRLSQRPVEVTIAGLPTDATAAPLILSEGMSEGVLVVNVAKGTPHGPIPLEVTATEHSENGAAAIVRRSGFVRGAAGSLDTTFGDHGMVANLYPMRTGTSYDLRIAHDGGVLISGFRAGAYGVSRLTPMGLSDPTFDDDGFLGLTTGAGAVFLDVHRDAPSTSLYRELVYVLVEKNDTSAELQRIDGTGKLVPSFNATGVVQLAPAGFPGRLRQVIALPDGKALVVTKRTADGIERMLSRWTATGAPDPTYADGGFCQLDTSVGPRFTPPQVLTLVRSDGSARVLFDESTTRGEETIGIKGCTRSGQVDTTIGVGPQHVVIRPNPGRYLAAAAITPSDEIVVLSESASYDGAPQESSLFRLDAALVQDASVGTNGTAVLPSGYFQSLAVEKDGSIMLLAGRGMTLALARTNRSGAVDRTFGEQGFATFGPELKKGWVDPIAFDIQQDGRIVVTGWKTDEETSFVARLWH